MGERHISISLDEELYEKAKRLADAEGVSVSDWLSRVASEVTDLESVKQAWDEYFARYGEPSVEVKQQTWERMKAEGHFEPESPEHFRMRMDALARLREPLPEHLDVPASRAPAVEQDQYEPERCAG